MLKALIMQSFGQGLLSRQSRTHYVLEKSFYRGLHLELLKLSEKA